jgi:hypothetical protein
VQEAAADALCKCVAHSAQGKAEADAKGVVPALAALLERDAAGGDVRV